MCTQRDHSVEKEPRFISETGQEARIAALIIPAIEPLGYRLVRIRLTGQQGLTLQIMAERFDGTMNIEDCEKISNLLSPLLDVEEIIDRHYHLEVSSPGIDRPMVRKSDFISWQGHLVKIETHAPIEGKRKIRGIIIAADEDRFTLRVDKAIYGEEKEVHFAYNDVEQARLILTDTLIREALARDKMLRKQNSEGSEDTEGASLEGKEK